MKTNSNTLATSQAHLRPATLDVSPRTLNQEESSADSLRRLLSAGLRASRWFTLLAALALLLGSNPARAADIYFDDGGTHTISDATYQDDDIYVQNGTHLTIETGAVLVGALFVEGSETVVTINGGTFGGAGDNSGYVHAYYDSKLTINGGNFGGTGIYSGYVRSDDTATVTINGGNYGGTAVLSGVVRAYDTSTVTINGGTFGSVGAFSGSVGAFGWGVVKINGGVFGGTGEDSGMVMTGDDDGDGITTVTVSGGVFGRTENHPVNFWIFSKSVMTFRASSFDTTSYDPAAGGILGVTFCSQAPQHIRIEKYELVTVNLETISCVVDSDGDGVVNSVDECPNSLDVGSTIKIGGTDTGVPNVVFANGCTISDQIAHLAAGARNHGQFVSGVGALKNSLRKAGILTARQAAAIQSVAAQSHLP